MNSETKTQQAEECALLRGFYERTKKQALNLARTLQDDLPDLIAAMERDEPERLLALCDRVERLSTRLRKRAITVARHYGNLCYRKGGAV